ncbi:MAG: hypothetical protein MUO72_06305 [Bacteroidales bacterium]|nr:hypothetical protein [Bacteroidales bacterium]
MASRYGLLIALIIAMTGYSCKEKGGKHIDEGEIHYTIEYMGNISPMHREIMPKNLVVSFKDDKILFDISSPFGNSGILNLTNPKENIFDTYISLFTIKQYYSSKPGEMQPGFDSMNGMVIRKTSKTAFICGFNCKNAEVTFPYNRKKVYNIWYTEEIDVNNPNASTPFRDLNGVLMSFFFFIGPAEMHFEAEAVYKKDIPDKAFERRDRYMRVSREDIARFITKMISL